MTELSQYVGLFITSFLLIAVIAVSSFQRNRRTQSEAPTTEDKRLQQMAIQLFYETDFPTAVVNRNLQIVFASNNFRDRFMHGETGTDFRTLFNQAPFAGVVELQAALGAYHKDGKLPECPCFVALKLFLEEDEWRLPATYFLLRTIRPDKESGEKLLSISMIDAGFVASTVMELNQKIALKDSNLKKLEELDRLKSEFLATLSHELKTPLVSIKGYLDLMATQKMGPLTEKQQKALAVSLKNTSHLNNLISSILNFARMEAGKLKFDMVNQKLQPNIADIVDSLKLLADGRNIALVTNIDPGLPAVVMDPDLIHRVLSNLIENSIKFSQPGTTVNIRVFQADTSRLQIDIVDQGCGIPADKIDSIKAPFFQADKSDTRPTGGLGLGLAIADKILAGHGTSLAITSEEGKGTCCSFWLYIAVAH